MPQQERELIIDGALAVVQVGVAHAARLDVDDHLARTGVGDHDRLDRDRLADRCGYDTLYFMWHDATLLLPVTATGSLDLRRRTNLCLCPG